jgi:diguanylate cyclase (GGDEF)-like protein
MSAGTVNETGQSEADLLVFHEIARALTSSLDLESILTKILRQMEGVFKPETWALMLCDERGRDLSCAIAGGLFGPSLSGRRVASGQGMAGWVMERGEVLLVSDPSSRALLEPGLDPYVDFDVRSAVCIPLCSRLRNLGVIQLFNLPSEVLSDYAVSYLLVLSDFAAIAVENSNAFQRVQELTIVDECTGLFNQRHFDQMLGAEITRAKRLHLPISLIFLDLDQFKLVNDQYGHQIGSLLLGEIGARIRSLVRSVDVAFRYGGDEFVILLPGTPQDLAIQVANRLRGGFLESPYKVGDDHFLSVTASLGVASFPEDGNTGQEILRAADARMYDAKRATGGEAAFPGPGRSLDRSA